MKILGISCFYHDSAVAAVKDEQICFAIQEERLSRVKHDSRFPIMAITKALEICNWKINDVDTIVFYENPELKLRRLYDQVISRWPHGWTLFSDHLPRFYKFKYPIEQIIRDNLRYNGPVKFIEHHRSHAASSFFTSPFEKALVLTIDGVGEYDTTAVFTGEGNLLIKKESIHFPDSLGLLYSVFTQYLGFEVNEGEYKVMGLAPYGTPRFVKKILDKMIFLNDDGSFHLDQSFFDFISREKHYSSNFIKSLGILPRKAGGLISQEHKDLAASIQKVLEIAILHMLKKLLAIYNYDSVCMAGGVALNCTANAEILRELGVKLYIQPAAGDAGGALGAAMDIAMEKISKSQYRFPFTPYLGTEYSDAAIKTILEINNITAHRLPNIAFIIAKHLSEGNVVGVVHGRDEWGPRALGNRSILADPRQANMKDHLNAKIKFREEFRPFAPVIMEEFASQYFEMLDMNNSPYMLFTHKTLKPNDIPAVVHEDNTSRIQTLSASQNPYLYAVLSEFYKITGIPVLINTSFNLKGEPIVSSPSDALKTFFASGIDFLAIENFLIEKTYDKRLSI